MVVFTISCDPLLPNHGRWLGLRPLSPELAAKTAAHLRIFVMGAVAACGPSTLALSTQYVQGEVSYAAWASSISVPMIGSLWLLGSCFCLDSQKSLYSIFLGAFLMPLINAWSDSVAIDALVSVIVRRALGFVNVTVLQYIALKQVSLGVSCFPLVGLGIYLVRVCMAGSNTASHMESSSHMLLLPEPELEGFSVAFGFMRVLTFLVFLLMWKGCSRRCSESRRVVPEMNGVVVPQVIGVALDVMIPGGPDDQQAVAFENEQAYDDEVASIGNLATRLYLFSVTGARSRYRHALGCPMTHSLLVTAFLLITN